MISNCNNNQYDYENSNKSRNKGQQTHVHEYQGSTMFAEEDEDRHNHRFAGVTGEAIRRGNSHVHKLATNTDFLDHHHEICDTTGPAIDVGDGKHVHFVEGYTTVRDGHRHEYVFATLIASPTVDEDDSDC